jgi:C4-dicarboxylate transporter, DctM subunit
MSAALIGSLSILAIVAAIFSGVHVAVALGLTSFIGIWLIRGSPEIALNLLAQSAVDSIAQYDFAVIPLFVLMGMFVMAADIGRDTFFVANRLLGRLRGGLGMGTVGANAVFAATTGVSIASAAVFTRIAVPEMIRHGYAPRLAVGVVAGSSVLGMLIPPSLLLIVFGILSEASVGDLFIGGLLPGIVLAVLFCITIAVIARRDPASAGGAQTGAAAGVDSIQELAITNWWNDVLRPLMPIVLLVGLVIGGLYGGLFTATEAGAVAALAAFAIALLRRKLTWKGLWGILQETGHITAAICILIIAASAYSRMLALSGLPGMVHEAIVSAELGLYGTLFIFIALIILLGTFLDSVSILLLTVPLAMPVFAQFGVDPVWLGVITVVAVEVGLLTPPLGIAAFVVKATLNDPRITLVDVFRGAFPFVLAMLVLIVLMVAFPPLVTGLVR